MSEEIIRKFHEIIIPSKIFKCSNEQCKKDLKKSEDGNLHRCSCGVLTCYLCKCGLSKENVTSHYVASAVCKLFTNDVEDIRHFSFENLKIVNMPHNNPMWKKSLHKKYGKFDEKYKSAGDWEFWIRCVSSGSRYLKYTAETLGLYYFNSKGMSTNPQNNKWKREEEKEVFRKYMYLLDK